MERAQKCQNEMSTVVNEFILRRTNNINAKHLPPKLVQVWAKPRTMYSRALWESQFGTGLFRPFVSGRVMRMIWRTRYIPVCFAVVAVWNRVVPVVGLRACEMGDLQDSVYVVVLCGNPSF